MVEITQRFQVKVTRYSLDEQGERVENGWFVSPVFAISANQKCFLVYDCEDVEQSRGFRWVDFTADHIELVED